MQSSAPEFESGASGRSRGPEETAQDPAKLRRPEMQGPLVAPEPVRSASDLVRLGFWSFSRSSESFLFSAKAKELFGLTPTDPVDLTQFVSGEALSQLLNAVKQDSAIEKLVSIEAGEEPLLFRGWLEYRGGDRIVGTLQRAHISLPEPRPEAPLEPIMVEAMEHGPDSMLVLRAIRNELGQPVDFELAETNSRGSQLLGYSREEAKGRLIGQLIPTAPEDGTIARYAEIMKNGQDVEQEFHVVPGGFQRIWIRQRIVPLRDGVAIFSSDVSSSRLADETADRSRRMFEKIAATTPDALLLWDVDTRRSIYRNGQTPEMLGTTDLVLFSSLEDRLAPIDHERFRAYLASIAAEPTDATLEEVFRSISPAEESKRFLVRSSVFDRRVDGRPKVVLTSVQDVTKQFQYRVELEEKMSELSTARAELEARQSELVSLNSRLSELALTDSVTGIRNRRAFQDKLEEESERAQRYNSRLALVLADLDHFKRYNDTYGHPEGDQALHGFAQVLMEVCRRSDTVARYGGEEFAIILPNASSSEAAILSERIRTALANTPFGRRGITVSLGCSEYLPGKEGKDRLLLEADQALYRSKESGRDRVTVFSS